MCCWTVLRAFSVQRKILSSTHVRCLTVHVCVKLSDSPILPVKCSITLLASRDSWIPPSATPMLITHLLCQPCNNGHNKTLHTDDSAYPKHFKIPFSPTAFPLYFLFCLCVFVSRRVSLGEIAHWAPSQMTGRSPAESESSSPSGGYVPVAVCSKLNGRRADFLSPSSPPACLCHPPCPHDTLRDRTLSLEQR